MVLCLCALGSVQAQNAQVANIHEVFASRLANDLTEAFHRLMNREY